MLLIRGTVEGTDTSLSYQEFGKDLHGQTPGVPGSSMAAAEPAALSSGGHPLHGSGKLAEEHRARQGAVGARERGTQRANEHQAKELVTFDLHT